MEDDTGADDETGAVAPIATAVPPVPPTSPCPGINVGVPEPACENYPLMLHSQLRLPFAVTFDHKSATAHSNACSKKAAANMEPCADCDGLVSMALFQNIVIRANNPALHRTRCNNAFLSGTQMQARYAHYRANHLRYRLIIMAQNRKIATLCSRLDDWKRIQTALSQNNIPRLRTLMAQMVRILVMRNSAGCEAPHARVLALFVHR